VPSNSDSNPDGNARSATVLSSSRVVPADPAAPHPDATPQPPPHQPALTYPRPAPTPHPAAAADPSA
jgi:hypothetical protein